MALPDPELDLLRELLQEDPADEVFLQVGEELVRRGEFAEAEQILSAGLEVLPETEGGWVLLARAAVEIGHAEQALLALQRGSTDPKTHPIAACINVLALEASGRFDVAREAAEAFLTVNPGDEEVIEALERMHAPEPEPRQRGADPFVNVSRAEQYAAIGRIDRAVRAFRRILFYNPGDRALEARLRQLQNQPHGYEPDDLSEELEDPSIAPPELKMPQPALQNVDNADEEVTEPALLSSEVMAFAKQEAASGAGRVVASTGVTNPPTARDTEVDELDPDDEITLDTGAEEALAEASGEGDEDEEERLTSVKAKGEIGEIARKKARRRRRSLIRR